VLFCSYYATLLEIVIRQSRITEASLMGAEAEDNYVRSELNESIIDVIDVIGAEPSLQIVLGMLQQCQSAGETADKYISIEACLNGVEVVAHFLGAEDHNSSSQLMAFLTTLPGHLPGLVRVRNKIIASFSNYLGGNPEYLPNLMELASTGLLSEHTTATSAYTLMSLFKFCPAVQESLDIPTFYGQVCQLRATGGLPVKSEVDILTGLSHILSEMDIASCENFLGHLIEPITTLIAGNISQHANQKDILDHLDRITALLSNTRCRRSALDAEAQHPVLSVFLKLLPTFQGILGAYPSEVVCEKVCRCYKHVMRNTQESFFPFLESMAAHVTHEFQTKPFASFIYVSSICVAIFGDSRQLMAGSTIVDNMKVILLKLYSEISSIFFAKCNRIETFEEFPDLVEEFFYFSARFAQILPEEFLSYSESINVLQAAVSGLSLRHREAQKGILLFFERFVDMPKQMHDLCASPMAGPNCVQLATVCQDLVLECMPSLVNAIFMSLSGAIPAYAIDENYGSIADVLWRLKKLCPNDFSVRIQCCEHAIISYLYCVDLTDVIMLYYLS
jgi:transportin-3